MPIKFFDEFGFTTKKIYTVEEYKSVNENYKPNDKSPIIGLVEGKSFVLDGVSRNGRFYPKQLWENVLKDPEVNQMLNDKLMFGCIGHPENYTLDELLASGKVSHIVTDIRLGNDGFGYATYEILDTPAGRILKTILEAGSKMKVSTRAFGEFVNEYKEIDGKRYQVINPKNFKLESIDFVIKPGIANVDVKLMEELEENNKKDLEKLKKSSIQICEDGICTLIEEVELHQKLEKQFDEELKKYKAIIKTLKEENKNLQDELIKKDKELNKEDLEKLKKQSETELKELLIAEIEDYFKKISLIKDRKDIVEKIINFLNEEEITYTLLNEFEEDLKNIDPTQLKNIIPIIEILKEKIKQKENEKNNIDLLKNVLDGVKEYFIKNEIQQVKNKYEEDINSYKELIKDLSKKIVEAKKQILEYNKLINEISKEKSALESKKKEVEEKLNKNIIKYKKVLKENDTLKSDYKSLKEKLVKIESLLTETEKAKEKLDLKVKTLEENFEVKVQKELIEKLEKEKYKLKKEIEKETKDKFNSMLESKLKDLQYELKESKKTIKLLENEINSKEKLIESLKAKKSVNESDVAKVNEKFKKKLNTLKEEVKFYQIQYLKSLYKNLDEAIIKETLNNINDIDKVKEVLEEKEINFYQIPEQKIEIVTKPKEVSLVEKLL